MYTDLVNKHFGNMKRQLIEKELSEFTANNQECVVLDVGAGKGANFAYLPPNASVICIEPDPLMRQALQTNVLGYPRVKLEKVIGGFAEDMSEIDSGSVDVVIATHVLCSVDDIKQTLKEIKRVLRKGGKYIYMEHVAARESNWLHYLQCILSPVWRWVLICRLDVDARQHIEGAGFASQKDEYFIVGQLEPIFSMFTIIWSHVTRPHLFGVAIK
ncbi:hypothetical protein CAPTEDRAFT_123758 [Capitella teleta]|uniref:Methyltransferase type 11 domain-containing protein n=1 Tax=Capitella teleta TaxID=283909 RepID=R7TND6_CAPTE|nr:hypothetical protein CAPTEDRAFT_123758 [Capitella teleta]|eukprot:ELT95057.1 hypothetical protein CAPTEDRAFT_123758 [Capitella teleta]